MTVVTIPKLTFEVEGAGCDSCATRVRRAVSALTVVYDISVDGDADTALVHVETGPEVTEDAVDRVLLDASTGSGHSYRVKPGSWRLVS